MRSSTIVAITCLIICTTACSQGYKIEKGYAYARNIISGVKPGVVLSEDGTVSKRSREPGIEYFIFAKTKDSSRPDIKNIWINGKPYFATAEKVVELPVVLESNPYDPTQMDTLVESGNGNTWKINVGQLIDSDSLLTKPSQTPYKEVYIGFFSRGKVHYYPISAIKYLEPTRLQ